MEVMFVILPLTFVVALGLLAVLVKGIKAGTYDDIEGEKYRILHED